VATIATELLLDLDGRKKTSTGTLLLGFTVIGVFFALTFGAFYWLVGLLVSWPSPIEAFSWYIGTASALIVATTLLAPFQRFWTTTLLGLSDLTIRITARALAPSATTPTEAVASGVDNVMLLMTHHAYRRLDERAPFLLVASLAGVWLTMFLSVLRGTAPTAQVSSPIQGSAIVKPGSYRSASVAFAPGIALKIDGVLARVGKWRIPIALEPEPTLAGAPWEALLSLAVDPELGGDRPSRLNPFRLGPLLPRSRGLSQGRTSVTALTGQIWSTLVRDAWLPGGDVVLSRDASEISPSIDILHVVGRPRATTSGVVIDLHDATSASAAEQLRPGDVGQFRQLRMIRPAQLPVRGMPLVIVQAEPVETTERFQSDRDEAALLRSFSHDAFAAGASTVITVPALPAPLTSAVIQLISRRLRVATRWGRFVAGFWLPIEPNAPIYPLHVVLGVVSDVRSMIAKWAPTANESGDRVDTYLELALDVALFGRRASVAVGSKPFGNPEGDF
jgi:hypothetical protein